MVYYKYDIIYYIEIYHYIIKNVNNTFYQLCATDLISVEIVFNAFNMFILLYYMLY